MKTVYKTLVPTCDFCKKVPAIFDAPTKFGSWAYMCEECSKTQKCSEIALFESGYRLKQRNPAEPVKSSEPKMAKEITGMEDMINIGDREVGCPDCGCTKSVEPDAGYTFNCEGCGILLKCQEIM